MTRRMFITLMLTVFLTALLAACNLVGSPEEPIDQTAVPSNTPAVTDSVSQNATSTLNPTVTLLPFITRQPPTAIVPPTSIAFATPTSSVSSIAIFSPVPGSIVSGTVTIFGSAVHPNFLQYQIEYGPDPNFSNLWYPIGTANIQPVQNNVLGVWATNTIPDGVYAIRMRVFLRDGGQLQTIANGIRVQNTVPTPRPTNTPSVPRPIAAFTQDRITGDVPLTVRFFNQSSGQIAGYQWQFGDGSTSNEINPTYTFRNAGVYTVTLTVSGPGGRSNVSRTINVNQGQPPLANFTADPRSGNAPLTVRFTDSSTGTINQRTWYFGDGATSNELNPTHTYQNTGEYNVILEVRGPGGATQKVRKVTVTQPNIPAPVASFTANPTSGDKPLIVRFTSTSSGQINSYLWEFGNGQTSIDPNPVYLYENEGTFDVSLTVSGPGGQSTATGRITVNKPIQAPDAGFTANPTQGQVPLNVQFTNTSTGDITGYEWNFGDGTALSTAKDPQHLYETAGTYTVRLTVFGPNSTVDFVEQVMTVTEPIVPPAAGFEALPEQGTAPLTVQFTNTSSGTQVTYTWDFGDGGTSDSQDTVVTHTYQAAGVYTVRLTASNAEGASDFAERTITVTSALPNAPTANFSVAVTDLTAQFTDSSTGDVTAWAWDFGDGATSTEQSPSHIYAAEGTYPVTLTVSNAGGSNSISQDVTVTAPLPGAPTANFSMAVIDLTAQFTDSSTGDVTAWAWDFGDGATSTEQSPSHTYAAEGTYPVTLTVSNAGGSNSIAQNVTVTAPLPGAPTANFSVAVTDLTAQFTDSSTGDVTAWAWDFGDGATSTEQSPSHTYAAEGTYPVTLTVSNAGGSNSISQNVTVTDPLPGAPTANFSVAVTDLTAQFTDSSTGDVTAWAWDFGDGATSTEQSPSHTYAAEGTYPVTLTVSNAGGSNSIAQNVTVTAPLPGAPTANFSVAVTDLTAQFTDSSTGDVTAWAWDFGDGATSTEQSPSHTYTAESTYPVTLTVSNAGGSNSISQDVTVTAPSTPSLADTTDVMPNIASLANGLSGMLGAENRTDVFAVIGDRSADAEFMRTFGDGDYALGNLTVENLQPVYDQFSVTEAAPGQNSFARAGAGVRPNFSTQDLLTQPADTPDCEAGESVLDCELRVTKPAVVFLAIGYNDARGIDPRMNDMAAFRANVEQIVDRVISAGAIPVLMTPYPRLGEEDTMRPYADTIIEVANARQIPVLNVWRLFNELPDSGLAGETPSVAPAGSDRLNDNNVTQFGANARHFYAFRILKALMEQVFP